MRPITPPPGAGLASLTGSVELLFTRRRDVSGSNSYMNIYCGNLSYSMTSDGLRAAFEVHGEVSSANVITDRDTGRSKGFGFVEMPNDSEGQAAIDAINGADLDGRPARVNEARPRPAGGGGGGGGGRRY